MERFKNEDIKSNKEICVDFNCNRDIEQSRVTWMEINSESQGFPLLNVIKN